MPATNSTRARSLWLVCLVLGLVTAAVYWPVSRHEFLTLDDQQYVTDNRQVQAGLSWAGVAWAFTTGEAQNWHPLTWLSHMWDCQLYGLNPRGHHLTNLLFHVCNTLLLLLWLNRTTGALWRSAFVAALFAWHPLRVESVAWIAERKDVLSAFFWLLTLIAYTRYTRKPAPLSYLLVLFLFALGLMSKPMVVTLPFVLLLVDMWPLNRLRLPFGGAENSPPGNGSRQLVPLIIEKLPFFVLAAADSVVTYLVQKSGGALWSTLALSPVDRASNAVVSYVRYLSKTCWPSDLAVVYPHPRHWPLLVTIGALLVLALWTALCLSRARRHPPLLFGWLWFLGTLVPTIGIVQVGSQAMADRYTYIPSIGLFIMTVWGLHELFSPRPAYRRYLALAGGAALAGFLVAASIQLSYWHDGVKLFRRTIEITTDNYFAYNCLGKALEKAGRNDEAAACYAESVRLTPRFPSSQFNLGMALSAQQQWTTACDHLGAAVALVPDNAEARYYFALALMNAGRLDEAAAQFAAALRLKPAFAQVHPAYGVVLARLNRLAEAIPHFAETVRQQPDNPESRFNLGLALLDNHQPAEAAVQFSAQLKLAPGETRAHYRLAQALEQQNALAEAVQHYRSALRLTPDFPEAKTALDRILSQHPELNSPSPMLDTPSPF